MGSPRTVKEAITPSQSTYQWLFFVMMIAIGIMILLVALILLQVSRKPLPYFFAENTQSETMNLTSYDSPNLMSSTIISWASKAAVAAYTFDFGDYANEIQQAKPYFTSDGWSAYLDAISRVSNRVVSQKLFVNGVVNGPAVISNQGPLAGFGLSWRLQIPFLVTYQSAETTRTEPFIVFMTIVRVPTIDNPQAIGIEQFALVTPPQ